MGTQVWVCSCTHCPQGSVGRVGTRHFSRWTIQVKYIKSSIAQLSKENLHRKPCLQYYRQKHVLSFSQVYVDTNKLPGGWLIESMHNTATMIIHPSSSHAEAVFTSGNVGWTIVKRVQQLQIIFQKLIFLPILKLNQPLLNFNYGKSHVTRACAIMVGHLQQLQIIFKNYPNFSNFQILNYKRAN